MIKSRQTNKLNERNELKHSNVVSGFLMIPLLAGLNVDHTYDCLSDGHFIRW